MLISANIELYTQKYRSLNKANNLASHSIWEWRSGVMEGPRVGMKVLA